ncbi:MAG: hypothetical protein AAGK02_16960, partial [Pseudomonadota bacterium]
NAMREATADFAEATRDATVSQQNWLTAYTEDRRERLRTQQAEDRLRLVFSPSCAAVATTDDPVELQRVLDTCRVSQVEGGRIVPAETFEDFEAILGLSDALQDYAESLILLTADWSEDRKALSEEASATGEALQGLHGSIAKISRSKSDGVIEQAPAIGGIIGTVAGAYLEAERLDALRDILGAADPLVAIATEYLRQADELALSQDRKDALTVLSARTDALRDLPINVAPPVFRAAQDDVWAAHEELLRITSVQSPFPQMREAHASLLLAAQKGGDADELQAAVMDILELAKSVKDVAEALSDEEQ